MSIANKQKAAALVLALGTDKSGELLQLLSEEEIKVLANEVAELDQIGAAERDYVYRETLANAGPSGSITGGMERAKELLAAFHGNAGNVLIEDGKRGPFGFLDPLGPKATAQLLEDEHPQTIAVIVSDMEADAASATVLGLAEDLRTEVSMRLATLAPVSPPMIELVATTLQARIGESAKVGAAVSDGAKALAEILNAGTKENEESILGFISGQDKALAERIRALMFVFDDILDIDDRGIQGILKTLNTQTLALALKGTADAVRDKITGNLSERAKVSLLEEMDLMGPVRRSEVEEAQNECVAQIRMLEESGEIVVGRGGSDDLVS